MPMPSDAFVSEVSIGSDPTVESTFGIDALKRLAEWIHILVENGSRRMALWRASRHLRALPDYLLKDIGIDRSAIDSIVENGRSD